MERSFHTQVGHVGEKGNQEQAGESETLVHTESHRGTKLEVRGPGADRVGPVPAAPASVSSREPCSVDSEDLALCCPPPALALPALCLRSDSERLLLVPDHKECFCPFTFGLCVAPTGSTA